MRIDEFVRLQEFNVSTLSLFGPDAKVINKKVRNKNILLDNLPEPIFVKLRKEQIYKDILDKDKKNQPSYKDIEDKVKEIDLGMKENAVHTHGL